MTKEEVLLELLTQQENAKETMVVYKKAYQEDKARAIQTKLGVLEILIEAMQKQILQTVTMKKFGDTLCRCGYEFSKENGDGYYIIPQDRLTDYCPKCGQRILIQK